MKSILIILLTLPVSLITETRIDGLYYEANSADPYTFEFKNNELIAQTDSMLHFGFQYTSYYDIENVNDTIFALQFVKQYVQDNNHPNRKRRRQKLKDGRSFWFQIDKFKYWTLHKKKDGTFNVSGYELNDNIYNKKIEISLVTTKPKLH
jgi:hypothetical protein